MRPVFIIAAVFIFGVLIALHELGHFVAAKLCGVKVNEFSVGMGPLIWQRQGAETYYSLRLLPVGGYCAMEGEDEDTGSERSFVRQPGWKKLIILLAGCAMNFLTGFVIILALFSGANAFLLDEINGFAPEFALEGEDGLMAGDLFYKIDGYRTYLRGDASLYLQYHQGDTIDLVVMRDGRKITLEDFPMKRQTCTAEDGSTYTGYGLMVGVRSVAGTPVNKIKFSWLQALDFMQMVRFSLVQLFSGGASMRDLSGPVGIVSAISEAGEQAATAKDAWGSVFYYAALIAVNLAVMNLLPIPALDGGRIFFLIADAVSLLLFRRRVPEKYQAAVNAAGMALLLGLMLFVTAQDIWRLFQ